MPGFTLAAILTLGLAIGAATAFFSVINGILIEPLPYRDPSRLVVISNTYGGNPSSNAVPDYMDRVRGGSTLESVAAFRPRDFNLTTDAASVHLSGGLVTSSLFDVLGVRPTLGRTFTPDEEKTGTDTVVVLSDGVWRKYLGTDPQIVGKRIVLDGQPRTVVGVMPPSFRMPLGTEEIWCPIVFTPDQLSESSRGNEFLTNIGRIHRTSTLEQVRAEMQALAARAVENGGSRRQFLINAKFSADVVSLSDQTVGAIRKPLFVLLGATGLILLIALANVANLLLARASARGREMFIRATLGAARTRLVAQLLTESVLLSMLGGIVGLLVAYGGVRSLTTFGLAGIPRLSDVAMDLRVFGFGAVLSVLTGILFGALPAWSMAGLTYSGSHAGSRESGASGKRLRQGVVVLQVAIAEILLVGAGLLVGTLDRLMSIDPGFQTESRLAFRVSLPSTTYSTPESQSGFFGRLIDRLTALQGVHAAGISTLSPFDVHNDTASFHVEGYEELPGVKPPGCDLRHITGGYPAAIGMPLILGRTFDDRDREGSPYVVLVDQRTAERFWPGQNPLGKRVRFGPAWREVVGVVGTIKNVRLDADAQAQIYIPFLQFPEPNMIVVIHGDSDPASLLEAARAALAEIDHTAPMFDVRTLEERIQESLAPRRYSMMLLGGFGLAGLMVSVIGIYGVIAYSVRQRTPEIGIRIALGAQRRQVLQMICRQGMTLAFGGVFLGVIGALWLTRFMEAMLYGVSRTDSATFFIVSFSLLAAAALASFVPASRAAHVDPAGILRGE
jgi:putative ABC transport system permease protein